jgi:hypothetical protein
VLRARRLGAANKAMNLLRCIVFLLISIQAATFTASAIDQPSAQPPAELPQQRHNHGDRAQKGKNGLAVRYAGALKLANTIAPFDFSSVFMCRFFVQVWHAGC